MRIASSLNALVISMSMFAACSSETSTTQQLISCETDPESGVILSCEEGGGDGGEDTCVDVDEDGDGQPTDGGGEGTILRTPIEGDSDCDGVPDVDDCDEQPGGDDDGGDEDEADLPYNFDMDAGGTYTPLVDAFAEKGPQPAEIVSIEFEAGGSWREAELLSGASFTVTQDDCDHAGNKDIGRDRIIVSWRNVDGSTETDHMTLRYCEE